MKGSLLEPKFLVLYQFVLEGLTYKSHMQEHEEDISSLYAALPYFYSAVFVRKNGSLVTPLGGVLFKSDIESNDAKFLDKVMEVARALQPAAQLIDKTTTFQLVPITEQDQQVPTEKDCHRIATETCTLVGNGGNA